MLPGWIAFTLSAALFQTWRTALQQRLRGQLSVNAAAVVRYLYGVPVGIALVLAYAAAFGGEVHPPGAMVLFLCAAGGLAQILGTNLLIMAFGYRNFAVGTAYSKTEAVQAALIASLLLGEHLSALSWAGIAVSLGGVLVLSLAGKGTRPADLLRGVAQPAALCGIASGLCFALTAILIREANRTLPGPDPVFRALLILVVTNSLQTAMQGGWLLLRERAQLRAVFASWRLSAPVGALSALGSACWFSAFALAPVALVRAVGQTEILFTLAFGRFYLGERAKRADILGALLLVGGVVLVLAGALAATSS